VSHRAAFGWPQGGVDPEVDAAGLVLVASAPLVGQLSVSIDNCFSADYDNYRMLFRGASSSAIPADMSIRLRRGGADDTTSNWSYLWIYALTASGPTRVANTAVDQGYICAAGSINGCFDLMIMNPNVIAPTTMIGHGYAQGSTNQNINFHGLNNSVVAAFDGFTLILPTATTGTISVYGYGKA